MKQLITSTTTLLLTLLISMGAWAEDEFCPNSKITCPEDSSRCIEKFWSDNGDLLYEQMTMVKEKLPVNAWDGFKWVDVIYDAENRSVNYVYTTNNDERGLEVLSGEYSGYFNNLCTLEKGLLCMVPGLTIKMVTYGENKKVINVKNYSREICRARGFSETTSDQTEYREGVTYEINSPNPFTGILVEHGFDGKVSSRENYNNGRLDGLSELYYDNGQLIFRVNFKEGREDGLAEFYFENGQLEIKGSYIQGKEDGLWESFYHTGAPASRILYKNNKVVLPSKYFDANGRKIVNGVVEIYNSKYSKSSTVKGLLKEKLTIKEGQRILYESFYNNGHLSSKGGFKNGNRDGIWEIYDGEGKLINTEIWKEGRQKL